MNTYVMAVQYFSMVATPLLWILEIIALVLFIRAAIIFIKVNNPKAKALKNSAEAVMVRDQKELDLPQEASDAASELPSDAKAEEGLKEDSKRADGGQEE